MGRCQDGLDAPACRTRFSTGVRPSRIGKWFSYSVTRLVVRASAKTRTKLTPVPRAGIEPATLGHKYSDGSREPRTAARGLPRSSDCPTEAGQTERLEDTRDVTTRARGPRVAPPTALPDELRNGRRNERGRGAEVGDCGPEKLGVVAERAQTVVVAGAQQATDRAGGVVVVRRQSKLPRLGLATERAAAALTLEKDRVVIPR